MLGMLSVVFCSNTVKILSTGDEAYTTCSMITMELLASLSNLEHNSVIRFFMAKNVSAVEIHQWLANVLDNYHTSSQVVCVSQQLTRFTP